MVAGYIGALAAVLTWRVTARYGLPWGVLTTLCELAGLAIVQLAVRASRAAWRAAAPPRGAR